MSKLGRGRGACESAERWDTGAMVELEGALGHLDRRQLEDGVALAGRDADRCDDLLHRLSDADAPRPDKGRQGDGEAAEERRGGGGER